MQRMHYQSPCLTSMCFCKWVMWSQNKILITLLFCISSQQQTQTWQGRMASMRRAVTVRSQWRTWCPQSSLSSELSGETTEIRLPSSVPLMLYLSSVKVACKQTLTATACFLTAFLKKCSQWIKVTGIFVATSAFTKKRSVEQPIKTHAFRKNHDWPEILWMQSHGEMQKSSVLSANLNYNMLKCYYGISAQWHQR